MRAAAVVAALLAGADEAGAEKWVEVGSETAAGGGVTVTWLLPADDVEAAGTSYRAPWVESRCRYDFHLTRKGNSKGKRRTHTGDCPVAAPFSSDGRWTILRSDQAKLLAVRTRRLQSVLQGKRKADVSIDIFPEGECSGPGDFDQWLSPQVFLFSGGACGSTLEWIYDLESGRRRRVGFSAAKAGDGPPRLWHEDPDSDLVAIRIDREKRVLLVRKANLVAVLLGDQKPAATTAFSGELAGIAGWRDGVFRFRVRKGDAVRALSVSLSKK